MLAGIDAYCLDSFIMVYKIVIFQLYEVFIYYLAYF